MKARAPSRRLGRENRSSVGFNRVFALGLSLSACLFGAVHAQDNPLVPANQDLTGVWWASTMPTSLKPMDGSAIPFTADGRKKYAQIQAGLKSGKIVDRAAYLCLPQGIPRAFLTAYPIQVLTIPTQTLFFFEQNRSNHHLKYNPKHNDPEFWDPSYMGDTIAHWEGDTLVADTTNFNDESYLDPSGIPHSDKLRVGQRIRRINDGKQLEVVVTVEDPDIFTKPWSARFVYDRRDDVQVDTSWVCGEPHRDVSKVRRTP